MRPRRMDWTDRVVLAGAGAALLVAPTQGSIELWPEAHLSLVDPILGATAVVWVGSVLRSRRRRALVPPAALVVFLALAAASLFVAENKTAALKNVIQFVLFFGAGFLVWRDLLRRFPRPALTGGIAIIAVGVLANLSLALWQYLHPDVSNFLVRGAFSNRNVYGGYLSLTAALPLAFVAHRRGGWPRVAAVAALAAAVLTLLSGAAFLAIVLSAGVGLLALRRGRGYLVLAAVLSILVVWGLPNLPRNNEEPLIASVAFYEPATGQPSRRYPEWQAAAIMTLENPWLGVGVGNYQRHVGRYYVLVPKRTGATEPDTQNLYLVLASSIGLPALLAFLAFAIGGVIRAARARACFPRGSLERTACWAAAVGLAGWMICALWSPLLVRGVFPVLCAWLAFAYAVRDENGMAGERKASPDPCRKGAPAPEHEQLTT